MPKRIEPTRLISWISLALFLVPFAAESSDDEALGSAAATVAEAVVEMPPVSIPPEWQSGTLSYRLLTKDDFKAKTSNSLWGNFSHAAEVCTMIIPTGEPGRFRATLRRECSFWNKVNVPVGRAVALASVLSGLPAVVPKKQPDWYILQHEQIHFAIMEVASRQLSRTMEKLAERHSGSNLALRAYELTLEHVEERHHEFDSETSGRFDPGGLERWVGVLERQLRELCGDATACPVRTALD